MQHESGHAQREREREEEEGETTITRTEAKSPPGLSVCSTGVLGTNCTTTILGTRVTCGGSFCFQSWNVLLMDGLEAYVILQQAVQ